MSTVALWQELDALKKMVRVFAAGFDARSLTPSSAEAVVAACALMEASLSSVKRLAAARAAEGTGWRHEGFRNPAEQLAAKTGMSPSAARRAIETGERMADQPEVAQAALAGDLSPEQAVAVADGAAADPSKARYLLDKAKRMSVPELNDEVARTKAAVADDQTRRARIRSRRSLKRWTDPEGALQAHLYGLPEDGALLWRALDPIRRRLIMVRRETGRPNESLMALDYDALQMLAAAAVGVDAELSLDDLLGLDLFPGLADTAPAAPGAGAATAPPADATSPPPPALPGMADLFSTLEPPAPPGPAVPPPDAGGKPVKRAKKLAGSPARIKIRIDLDAFLRGCRVGDEVCEIDGYGPIDVSYVHALINSGQAQIAAILTRQTKVTGVFLDRRRPNAWQKAAVDFTQATCSVEGCNARAGLEYDHRVPYAETGYTIIDLIDRLCRSHHKRKTFEDWSLVDGVGKRPFVPPDDPRHPRHKAGADGGEGPAP